MPTPTAPFPPQCLSTHCMMLVFLRSRSLRLTCLSGLYLPRFGAPVPSSTSLSCPPAFSHLRQSSCPLHYLLPSSIHYLRCLRRRCWSTTLHSSIWMHPHRQAIALNCWGRHLRKYIEHFWIALSTGARLLAYVHPCCGRLHPTHAHANMQKQPLRVEP